MRKKLLSALLGTTMVVSMLAGCGSSAETSTTQTTADQKETTAAATEAASTEAASTEAAAAESTGTGKVYYLNFKPEQADDWKNLAAKYTEETGVQVDVETAASGTYESTLKSEIAKTDAPTLFQVNGPVGLATWKDYCYDLSGSDVYGQLKSDDFALKDGDATLGIAYVTETYGIIYNADILNDYFTKDYAVVKSVDEINSFDKLKAVADSIQENKDDLGVRVLSLQQVWIQAPTGDSRHILQTFLSTMNTRQTASALQMQSRVHILTTTRLSGIYILQIPPVHLQYFPARPAKMQQQSLLSVKQYSIRMVHGHTQI